MKEFLLSDESTNSYGFMVLTSGINLKRFEQNPVMYYNHERHNGVIGKWTNLRVSDGKLYGTPVFDEKDELGSRIGRKVQDEFIKAASIGVDDVVWGEIGGKRTVLSCEMKECSICDIPSNSNALMLYANNKPLTKKEVIELCNTQNMNDMNTDLKPITEVLGLPENTGVDEIVKTINRLINQNDPQTKVEQALNSGIIAQYECAELLQLAAMNPVSFHTYMGKRKEKAVQEREEKGLILTNEALRDGRLNCDSQGVVRNFWMKSFCEDFESTKMALSSLPKRVIIGDMIQNGKTDSTEDRGQWTLNDYRKKAPLELKNNPDLYQRLLEEENSKNKSKMN